MAALRVLLLLLVLPVYIQGADECRCASSVSCVTYPDVNCTCQDSWSGPKCQMNNIAEGDIGRTQLSQGSSDPDIVVDGLVSETVPQTCTSITDKYGVKASWTIIFNSEHEISRMKIYHYAGYAASLKLFEVHVETELCIRYTSESNPPSVLDITCGQPLTGRFLTISIPRSSFDYYTLALCEVQIYVCGDYWWGDQCDRRCSCVDSSEVCNKFDGSCSSGTRETTTTTTFKTTTSSTQPGTTTPPLTSPMTSTPVPSTESQTDVPDLDTATESRTTAQPTQSTTEPGVTKSAMTLGEIPIVAICVVVGVVVIVFLGVSVFLKLRHTRRPRVEDTTMKQVKVISDHYTYPNEYVKSFPNAMMADKGGNYYTTPKQLQAPMDYDDAVSPPPVVTGKSHYDQVKPVSEDEDHVYSELDNVSYDYSYLEPVHEEEMK